MENVTKKLDRLAVRALAESHSAELLATSKAGGNPYQKALEHQDKANQFADTLSPEDAAAFLIMYSEELNACAQKTLDDANALLAKTQAANLSAEAAGSVIGLLVLLFLLFMIFKQS